MNAFTAVGALMILFSVFCLVVVVLSHTVLGPVYGFLYDSCYMLFKDIVAASLAAYLAIALLFGLLLLMLGALRP